MSHFSFLSADPVIARTREQMLSGNYFFVPLNQLSDRITEKDAVKIDRLDRIDRLFLASHAMIEKAVLWVKDFTTFFEIRDTGWTTNKYSASLSESIQALKHQSNGQTTALQGTRVFKIAVFRERGSLDSL